MLKLQRAKHILRQEKCFGEEIKVVILLTNITVFPSVR